MVKCKFNQEMQVQSSLDGRTDESIRGGRVANALACSAVEVTSSRPSFGDILEINFSNRYSLQHRGTSISLFGIVRIVMSADRISGFRPNVTFRIAIQMHSLFYYNY